MRTHTHRHTHTTHIFKKCKGWVHVRTMCLDTLSFNKPVANCASVLLFFLSVSPDQSINLNAYQSLHLSSLFSSSSKVTNIRKRRIKNLFECWLQVLLEANVIWVTLIRFALSLLFLISQQSLIQLSSPLCCSSSGSSGSSTSQDLARSQTEFHSLRSGFELAWRVFNVCDNFPWGVKREWVCEQACECVGFEGLSE